MSGSARRRHYDTSTDPLLGRIRREVVSALGILVVAFNLVAGVLVASQSTAASPYLEELFGDRIVVCTGAGMIVLDHDGNPVEGQGGGEPMCVFCLPLMQGSADAPVVVALLDAPLAVDFAAWIDAARPATPARPTLSSASPRGPPRV